MVVVDCQVEVRGAEQDHIPNKGQLVLANAPITGWFIDSYEHGLLDGPGNGMSLPTHHGENVQFGMVTRGVGTVIDKAKCPEMLLLPLPKDPCRLPCALLFTIQPIAFVPVYYSAFLGDVVLVLGCHQEAFHSIASPETDLDAYLTTNDLDTCADTFGTGNHNMDVTVVVVSADVITPGAGMGLYAAVFKVVPGLSLWRSHVGYLHLVRAFLCNPLP